MMLTFGAGVLAATVLTAVLTAQFVRNPAATPSLPVRTPQQRA